MQGPKYERRFSFSKASPSPAHFYEFRNASRAPWACRRAKNEVIRYPSNDGGTEVTTPTDAVAA
jgi:hypothetical protein